MRHWTTEDSRRMRGLLNAGLCYSAVGREFDTYGFQVKVMTTPGWKPFSFPLADRLWRTVRKRGPDQCWLWRGYINKYGYGHIGNGGVTYRVHRIVYELTHGKIPKGLFVLHSCDSRACCNPAHLMVGDQVENMRQASERNRLFDQVGKQKVRYSDETVRAVKRDLKRGRLTQGEIGDRHGMPGHYVCRLANGRVRKDG